MVHVDPLCSLSVYSNELPESAPVQKKKLCLVQLCSSHGKVSVRQQDCSQKRTTQGSLAFHCVTVLLAALCREVQVPIKRKKCFENTFQKLKKKKKKAPQKNISTFEGAKSFLKRLGQCQVLLLQGKRGCTSRGVTQQEYFTGQTCCFTEDLFPKCLCHPHRTVLWHLPHPVPPQSRWASIFWPWHHLWGQQCLGCRWRGLSAVAG